MERTVLYSYLDVFHADLALAELKNDGVSADIVKIEKLDFGPMYSLLVPMYDIEKAIIVLDKLENE
jgi:hypothetical protein